MGYVAVYGARGRTMAQNVMQKIQELSEERERLISREGSHHAGEEDHARLERIDHDLQVLWDLRRRELAGEQIRLDEDYYDSYTRYNDAGDPPGR
jgi:ATP phosphoribosyltransferase